MALLVRATAPLLGLLALSTLVSGVMFALAEHDLSGAIVVAITLVLLIDAVIFVVLAWASLTPGPTWRPAALVLIAVNLIAIVLDQVGIADIVVIVLLILTALAVLATPRSRSDER